MDKALWLDYHDFVIKWSFSYYSYVSFVKPTTHIYIYMCVYASLVVGRGLQLVSWFFDWCHDIEEACLYINFVFHVTCKTDLSKLQICKF